MDGGLAIRSVGADDLVQCIATPGIQVTHVVYRGSPLATGLFDGGTSSIGFDHGMVLSTGDVLNVVGPNTHDDVTASHGLAGDADLERLVPGLNTYDAATLEFDFECSAAAEFSIGYVFGSDEYNEFVGGQYNDVFAFFLDGVSAADNVALVPAGCGGPVGVPVSINGVNCGYPYPFIGANCDCYRNNDFTDGGGSIATEMDGLTHVFTRTVTIAPGLHHLKIAIADASDDFIDSNIFIACGSLACIGATPTRKSSWGDVKTIYR